MFPEVPIALRLSGHLLLGVVRIYSKKVDYLYHDCNEVLSQIRRMFASVHVNLPEDADRATFQAVTLPDTFELDALEFDTQYLEESPDKHLKDVEQITLPDQIPVEGQYVEILVNEDRFASSPQAELPNFAASDGPVNEEVLPQCGEVNNHYVDPISWGGLSVESLHQSVDADQTIGDLPPIEAARAAAHIFGPDTNNDNLAPDGSIDCSGNKKDSVSPAMERPISGKEPHPLVMPENSPAAASLDAPSRLNVEASAGEESLGMELRPSPHGKGQKQNAQKRKRKRFFDEAIVLSNVEMKRRLEDTSKIVRKRQKNPSTTLDVWKVQKHMKKDQMFNEPLLCGMCMKLQNVYERAFPIVMVVSSPNTTHGIDVEMPDVEVNQARHSGMQDQDLGEAEMEIEQARNNVVHDQDQHEPMQSSFGRELDPIDAVTSINASLSIDAGMDVEVPDVEVNLARHSGMQDQGLHEAEMEIEQARNNVVHDQDPREPMQSSFGRELAPIDAVTSIKASLSKGTRTFELETPSGLGDPASAERLDYITQMLSGNIEEPLLPEIGRSAEVPGLRNSPEEDLCFLNAENTSPSPSGYESRRFDGMSSRTR